MKKTIAILLMLCLCIGLSACTETKEEPSESTIDKEQNTEPVKVAVEKEIYAVTYEESLLGTYEYTDYVYDEQGKITQYKVSGNSHATVYLEYNSDGLLASREEVCSYGYETDNYIYDANGYLIREYCESDYSINNGKEYTYSYTFNDKGQIESKILENVNDDYTVEYSYIYDENGLLIREREHTINSTYITEFVYDEYGNVIEEHISKLNNSDDGWINYYRYECIGTYTVYELASA